MMKATIQISPRPIHTNLLLPVLGMLILHPWVTQAGVTFEKIADTNTSIPEGTGQFEYFSAPVIDGNKIAFVAGSTLAPDGQEVIYLHDGAKLSRVVDQATALPDTNQAPGRFNRISMRIREG